MCKKLLIEYYRDKNRNPIGVVVATNKDVVGWSLCHIKAIYYHPSDKFDKKLGLNIAIQRADKASAMSESEKVEYYTSKVPQSLQKLFLKIMTKSENYFKD